MDMETFLVRVLDGIEERETRLLTWGIVDAAFTRDELLELLNQFIDEALNDGLEDYCPAETVLQTLLDRQWITGALLPGNAIGYRSRMAETVRLLQHLRQLFPKHGIANGWQQAPRLVADFRFLRRRRRYPVRDIAVDQIIARIGEVTGQSPLIKNAVQALLTAPDREVRLSGFQVRAAQRILRGIHERRELATIVCAGTGSGKTLAFYLPALASIYRHKRENAAESWVKVVALYPRTELLKDQLREVLQRIRGLQAALPPQDRVSIRVGALYGDIPHTAHYCDKWASVGQDRVCPVLVCLQCGGELRWQHQDRIKEIERLVCARPGCGSVLDGSEFPLTRQSLKQRAPDILFTTTEMLNQRLSDNAMQHLFGVGVGALHAPELVLMDEVHTYESQHGAQVAYLMRRWQHLVKRPLRFVGLSATLREAPRFFAQLTGCRPHLVDEVSPQADEIQSEGAEYMIALRGDPVSRTALLSTTIQTTMALQRCLDPKRQPSVSHGLFGQRTFVFTDNLDVINRLYFNLLDAEGRDSSGNPNGIKAPEGGLAILRQQEMSFLRYANGQDWRFCQNLHQPEGLSRRLDIKRVSSQDRGVDANAEVIVATAVLEVGFDDPLVGAVIQHKAPRSMAGFLQRKGRGGRTRGMRPWTAVVLSDYGRDRIAYQGYDLLFDPELPVRTLPLQNRYITRMQAVYATIDYLAMRLQDIPNGSVWLDLSGGTNIDAIRRGALIREVREILETETGTQRLMNHIRQALDLPNEELSALLWEYPRPLLTTVLPTALRRLETRWQAYGEPGKDYKVANNPLPEFIPGSLFSDFELAEVAINLPENPNQPVGFDRRAMSVYAGLREFAPGRVTRRYGVQHGAQRHWISPVSDDIHAGIVGISLLDVDTLGEMVMLGEYQIRHQEEIITLPVLRPASLAPKRPPQAVQDSSNASLKWHTQIVATVEPVWLTPPDGSLWADIIPRIGFFTHSRQASVEVRRFAVGSVAGIRLDAQMIQVETQFQRNNQSAGLGAQFSADGMVFQVQVPPDLYTQRPGDEAKWRALRSARFIDLARRGERLAMVGSPFIREWLAQIYLSALAYVVIDQQISLSEANTAIQQGQATIGLQDVLLQLFQAYVVDDQEQQEAIGGEDRLRQELEACLNTPDILTELHDFGSILWEPVDAGWQPWLRGVYLATLAASISRSITDLCPGIDPEDLLVDLDRGPVLAGQDVGLDSEKKELWFTEKNPGGNGLIEEFMACHAQDPRRFFTTVHANLGMGEFELIDHQLQKIVTLLASDKGQDELSEQVTRYRTAQNQEEMTQTFQDLRRTLMQEGFSPFHGFLVALGNRILRPGSSRATDAYLANILSRWQQEEERTGIEVDLRVMSYYLSQSNEIDPIVEGIIGDAHAINALRLNAIQGLLWPRGRATRESALQIRNPFVELPLVERLLVIDTLIDDRPGISVRDEEWFTQTSAHLIAGRQVTLTCPTINRDSLAKAINLLITNPVDTGYLKAYARLQGIRRTPSLIEADLELVEARQ